jgi:putative transposase
MEEHGVYHRRRLPHWDLPGATYFVTTCLAGSIPAEGLLDLARYRAGLLRHHDKRKVCSEDWNLRQWKQTFARADWWLDVNSAVRHFIDPRLAAVVVEACQFWAGSRYELLAYAVMPSHLHWVFRPLVGQVGNLPHAKPQVGNYEVGQVGNLPHPRSPREQIMHTLKRHTARQCNRLLGRHGAFWQDESYDHCVRDDGELERIIQYVEYNPVKAGLVTEPEQWPFSSAQHRAERGLLLGQPLVREEGLAG